MVKSLEQLGVLVPMALQVQGLDRDNTDLLTSVYHESGPIPLLVLWSLGFRDLDTANAYGDTPLMVKCQVARAFGEWNQLHSCSWLLEHGADLCKVDRQGVSAGHHIYHTIGTYVRVVPSPRSPASLEDCVLALTTKLSPQNPHDRCRCACSPGGCTPFVWFLRASSWILIDSWRSSWRSSAAELASQLLAIFIRTHKSMTMAQIRSAIRLATFKALDMRHTCCQNGHYKPWEREEEFDELRQEDRSLTILFEELVEEFEQEMGQLRRESHVNKSISFWNGYRLPRMRHVVESMESAEMEEKDKAAAEEVGVVWSEKISVERDKSYENKSEDGSNEEDRSYHESDWDSDVDERDMFRTFKTMNDWISRLDLIVSKARVSQ